jgi:hypothetical protein
MNRLEALEWAAGNIFENNNPEDVVLRFSVCMDVLEIFILSTDRDIPECPMPWAGRIHIWSTVSGIKTELKCLSGYFNPDTTTELNPDLLKSEHVNLLLNPITEGWIKQGA